MRCTHSLRTSEEGQQREQAQEHRHCAPNVFAATVRLPQEALNMSQACADELGMTRDGRSLPRSACNSLGWRLSVRTANLFFCCSRALLPVPDQHCWAVSPTAANASVMHWVHSSGTSRTDLCSLDQPGAPQFLAVHHSLVVCR